MVRVGKHSFWRIDTKAKFRAAPPVEISARMSLTGWS
jgi:hypothetical protein